MLHGAGIFANIYPKNHPNVGKYSIHGASGYGNPSFFSETGGVYESGVKMKGAFDGFPLKEFFLR